MVMAGPSQPHSSSNSHSCSNDNSPATGGDTNTSHRKRDRDDDEPNEDKNEKKREKDGHLKTDQADFSESGRCQCMDAVMHVFRCFGRRPVDEAGGFLSKFCEECTRQIGDPGSLKGICVSVTV